MNGSQTKAADQHAWISWLRDAARVGSLPDPLSPSGRLLARGAAELLRESPLPQPVLVTLAGRHAASISAAFCEALAELQAHGQVDGDKLNARVGRAGATLVEEIDVPDLVRQACGLRVAPPTTATYVGYLEPGHQLELHLDLHGFGDLVFFSASSMTPLRPRAARPSW